MGRSADPAKADPLTQAADALASELQSFADLSTSLAKEPLSSQKSLERAARLLGEAIQVEDRLGSSARQLVEVIAEARTRQEGLAETLRTRALELQARTAAYQGLLGRYEFLGQIAAQVNQAVLRAASSAKSGDLAEMKAALPGLLESVEKAIGAARELVEAAQQEQFDDVGRNADSLRQQLLAARNKMSLLNGKMLMTLLGVVALAHLLPLPG
jgi:hypothetical protein